MLNMPLLRKIVKFGNGKGIFLPADWLRYLEQERGERPKQVSIEVNEELIIKPIFHKKGEDHG